MLVHDDVYDEVAARVVEAARSMTVGDPFEPGTILSPLVTKAAQQRVLAMIERAQADGAGKLLIGGGVPAAGCAGKGFYVEPTVFGDVDPASELGQVEVFGPVLSLMRFSTEEEAVRIANGTPYGLASYVWTSDQGRINRLSTQLRAGGVYVNGRQPGHRLRAAVRRRRHLRLRPRGRPGGTLRVPAHEGRGDRMTIPLTLTARSPSSPAAGSGIGRATALVLRRAAARRSWSAICDGSGRRRWPPRSARPAARRWPQPADVTQGG